jgi:hypothetical protein
MTADPEILSLAETAEAIGKSYDWFLRHRQELVARGFPPPIDEPGRPRWRAWQVDAWVRGDDWSAPAVDPARYADALDRRARELAAEIAERAGSRRAH